MAQCQTPVYAMLKRSRKSGTERHRPQQGATAINLAQTGPWLFTDRAAEHPMRLLKCMICIAIVYVLSPVNGLTERSALDVAAKAVIAAHALVPEAQKTVAIVGARAASAGHTPDVSLLAQLVGAFWPGQAPTQTAHPAPGTRAVKATAGTQIPAKAAADRQMLADSPRR